MGQYHADLYVKVRNFGSTSWSSPQILQQFSGVREIVSAANSVDGITHIVYEIFDGVGYRNYNGSSWSAEEPIGSGYISPRIYAVSNDLFVAWGKDAPAQNKFIHYRQYDANPHTPQGLTVSIYTLGTNTYPKLNWNLNTEPDVYNQTNAYPIERRIRLWDGPWGQWAFLAYRNGNQSEFIDYSIGGLHNEAYTAEYRISAKDVNNHFSDYSSSVSINFSKFNKTNNGLVKYDFELDQNYPNPFNPITTINYSIKSTGLVTLKVYDMLGIEVASIVNEIKEAGNYSVTFNASELPSGIYFYQLRAGSFIETKKMLLLK
ncbi:MAG: T9SS type A sorting domain-containing protein [Ignavibacteriaceae bacterium]|nr:T9SS type A sorting domain-containing protein [Ignavibacteriaceae bacterium]